MPDKYQNIEILESICSQGCRHVNSVIKQIESGEITEYTRQLSSDECQRLLLELKSIMDVYLLQDK